MQWRVQWRNATPNRRTAPANSIGTTPAQALLLASYLNTDQLRPSQRAKNTPHARTPVALCPFCSVSRALRASPSRWPGRGCNRMQNRDALHARACMCACAPGPDHDREGKRSAEKLGGHNNLIIPCVRARRGCYCYRTSPARSVIVIGLARAGLPGGCSPVRACVLA